MRFWIGSTLVVVAVLFFIEAVGDYPPAGIKIAADSHLLVPFMPRTGLAIGLFCLSILVSFGVWGLLAPLAANGVIAAETVITGALTTGCALFAVVYAAGWWLVLA